MIHFYKANNINADTKIQQLRNAYNGIVNMSYYYKDYTKYGHKIRKLITYLNGQLHMIETIEPLPIQLKSSSQENITKTIEKPPITLHEITLDSESEAEPTIEQESDKHVKPKKSKPPTLLHKIKTTVYSIVTTISTYIQNGFRRLFFFL